MSIANKQAGKLRIIAGQWRGRTLRFVDQTGLRPTHDRVRETLFNWLQVDIVGARCLDLFAGSGALSFEALSRGAHSALLVEANADSASALLSIKQQLQADSAHVLHQRFSETMTPPGSNFDVVFLDPPYYQGLVEPALRWLLQHRLLSQNALIYIEAERGFDLCGFDSCLSLYRQKHTKQMVYSLYRYNDSTQV